MSFKPEEATLEELLARAERRNMYPTFIARLAVEIQRNPDNTTILAWMQSHSDEIVKAASANQTDWFDFFAKLFGDRLADIISLHDWMINTFVPIDKRKNTVVNLFKTAPPQHGGLTVMRRYLQDREIVALVLRTLRDCEIVPDTIDGSTIQRGDDFVATFLNPDVTLIERDGDLIWPTETDTWWSIFGPKDFVDALTVCVKRRPDAFLARRRPDHRHTPLDMVHANMHRFGGTRVHIVNRLVRDAFQNLDDLRLAKEATFFVLSADMQEHLIHKHKGGSLFLLLAFTLVKKSTSALREYGSRVMRITSHDTAASVFERLRIELNEGNAIACEINRFLRIQLQRVGFIIAAVDFDANGPFVQIQGTRYIPDSDSDLRAARSLGVFVEVVFTNRPSSGKPREQAWRMYRIA